MISQCSPSVVRMIVPLRPTIQHTVAEGAEPATRSVLTPLFCTFNPGLFASRRRTIPFWPTIHVTDRSGDTIVTGTSGPPDAPPTVRVAKSPRSAILSDRGAGAFGAAAPDCAVIDAAPEASACLCAVCEENAPIVSARGQPPSSSSLHPWRSRSKFAPAAARRAQWLATPVQPLERAHARRDSSAELHGSSAPVAERHSSQARSTQERVRWEPPPELTEQARAPVRQPRCSELHSSPSRPADLSVPDSRDALSQQKRARLRPRRARESRCAIFDTMGLQMPPSRRARSRRRVRYPPT